MQKLLSSCRYGWLKAFESSAIKRRAEYEMHCKLSSSFIRLEQWNVRSCSLYPECKYNALCKKHNFFQSKQWRRPRSLHGWRAFAYFRRENYPLSSPADAGRYKLFRRAQFPGRLNSPFWRRGASKIQKPPRASSCTIHSVSHACTALAFNAKLAHVINYAHLIGGVSRPAGPEWSGEGDRVHHEHHLLASGKIFIYTGV